MQPSKSQGLLGPLSDVLQEVYSHGGPILLNGGVTEGSEHAVQYQTR